TVSATLPRNNRKAESNLPTLICSAQGACFKTPGIPYNAGRSQLRRRDEMGAAKTNHAVVIVGGGPTGLMLAGELALAGVDVAIVERRASQELVGSRAGGLHARTIEALDQRGVADRFLSRGQTYPVVHFHVPLD